MKVTSAIVGGGSSDINEGMGEGISFDEIPDVISNGFISCPKWALLVSALNIGIFEKSSISEGGNIA